MTNDSKGMVLGMLGVVFFGLTLPATRFVVPYLDPVFIGLGRAVLAALVAGVLLLVTRQPLPNRKQLGELLIIAVCVAVGFPVLTASAMQTVPASHGGVVLGLLPLMSAIAGALIAGDKPSGGFWMAAVVGSGIVVSYSLIQGAGSFAIGDIALFGAILFAALGYALSGRLSREIGGWQVICWALVVGLPFLIVPAWLSAPRSFTGIPGSAWLGFLYLALFSQLFGFFFWNRGLAIGGVARVSQTQLLQPFVTIGASAWLLSEVIGTLTIVFALLVIGMVAVGKKMPVYRRH